jgi:hypothetical protein
METKDFRRVSRRKTGRWMGAVQKPVMLLGDDFKLLSCYHPAEMTYGW